MKIGIDLGTTNSALAWIDPAEAGEQQFPPLHLLEIPQVTAQDRVEALRTLPSFLFVDDQEYVGTYAREQGALVPTRLVHSAKSWLSNSEVDRTAKILPWEAEASGRRYSPVEASARYLGHIAEAWEKKHSAPLGEQEVVLTVPASFDEEGRELTVAAAREAGLERVTLLEEPAAAFYAWIAKHLAQSRKSLFAGQVVLVCDVGGGTSDFTLIRVGRDGDRVDFTRTAVGRHLLLGGDNLDLTLGWLVEAKLGKQLSVKQRSALRRQCAAAKERLLCEENLKSVEITVIGAGSGLVGGTLKTEILREEVLQLTYSGFLPPCSLSDQPKEEKRSLFRELGLPYVSDPAVTRHLAAFLSTAGEPLPEGPDAILFNGGFFIPEVCRKRVTDVVEHWYGRRPAVFENQELDLAVAMGAAYYAYARTTGQGVMVRAGLPRAYFIGIGGAAGAEAERAVCLIPRGAEEGETRELDLENLQLVANRPVTFRLYSSLTRAEDAAGAVVEIPTAGTETEFHCHAPLTALIRFGKRTEERLVPVRLGARLTEIGTLDIWCESKVSEHRWRLEFQLRKAATECAPAERRTSAVISEDAQQTALELISAVFEGREGAPAPEELPSRLEQVLALGRGSWPVAVLRRLGDRLLEVVAGRVRSAASEIRWLNLTGFCLRPGFGFPGDELRIEQSRRVYAAGLGFGNQVQNEIEWWIFWGRLAGGLNRNQQVEMFQRLSPILLPRKQKRPRVNPSLLREMFRTAASLELLPAQTKQELGDAVLGLLKEGQHKDAALWCLSRLGARALFYGPANQAAPPAKVARWVEVLLPVPGAAEAVALMARQTGDPVRDLPVVTRNQVRRLLEQHPQRDRLVAVLDGDQALDDRTRDHVYGEELPAGLVFAAPSTEA